MRVNIDQIKTVKTCKSCKNYRYSVWDEAWSWLTDTGPRCYRTLPAVTVDIVTGNVRIPSIAQCDKCERERESDYSGSCGPKAIHWSPRKKDGLFELIKHTDEVSSK